MPTSVDGSKVGRLKLSTCCRFSEVISPSGFPSFATDTVAAETIRLSASNCETPMWVKRVGVAEGALHLDRLARLERRLHAPA